MPKKIAIILTGCGYLDGSEINEAVLSALAVENQGDSYQFFSIDQAQKRVVSHITEEPLSGGERNVFEESARIARGNIEKLSQLDPTKYDALWMPGGFGVAIALSDFAEKKEQCSVNPEFKKIIQAFFQANKPIIGVCLAPVVLAKSLEGLGQVKMTLGTNEEFNILLSKMGMKPKSCHVHEVCFDKEAKVYTTPAYMEKDATPLKVFQALQKIAEDLE